MQRLKPRRGRVIFDLQEGYGSSLAGQKHSEDPTGTFVDSAREDRSH